MPDLPRFLLLHGAFHVGTAWDGVIAALAETGFAAEAITFPGHGRSVGRAGVAFADYEDALIAALDRQPRPVILVGHSAAGVVMQAAAPRSPDKVAAAVFHNAFILEHDRSMIESIPPDGAAAAAPDNSLAVDAGFVAQVLMAGADAAAIDRTLAELVPQPFGYYTHRVDTRPFAAMTCPRYVLLAADDASLPREAWLAMAGHLGDYKLFEMPGGHEALYTDPESLARALAAIARDFDAS
ncbi:MAG: alpha/beta fold hydrolase [Alphaproteobacteria bacterium]|nr:alpha/beta fold hydrolase [Alphaproteobacteria bacterium]